ncbi:hypothetical protein V1279_004203 [Bradyrhizobium sp. AZCC 1610]
MRLKPREALFHGVLALRLTPLGEEEKIYGRDRLLAHTYMLGPSGQSNEASSSDEQLRIRESTYPESQDDICGSRAGSGFCIRAKPDNPPAPRSSKALSSAKGKCWKRSIRRSGANREHLPCAGIGTFGHCYRITHAYFSVASGGPFASNS